MGYDIWMSGLCEYLLKKGRITELQLFRARSKCATVNLKTGQCAYAFGFIDRDQIGTVLGIQQRTGQKFGDIAVALGHLAPGQLHTILTLQQKYRVSPEDMLVREGALSREDLDRERQVFELSQKPAS